MPLRVNALEGLDNLAAQIRELRDSRALTQAEFAQELGVSARTVQYWEAGQTPLPRHRRALRDFERRTEEQAA